MKITSLLDYFNLKTLLVIGFLTHILSAITVLVIGYSGKFPQFINESGVLRTDAIFYTEICAALARQIGEGEFSYFFTNTEQFHVKIYTIFYFLFSPLFGENVLCFEPLNVMLFLFILFFIYKIGEACFDSTTGFLAALVINFYPTFLVHTTQPLRDSFFILIFLAIVNCLIILLKKSFSTPALALRLIGCYFLLILIWFIRDSGFPVYAATVTVALLLFILKCRRNFRNHFKEIILFICFIGLVISIPFVFKSFTPQKTAYSDNQLAVLKTLRRNLENEGLSKTLIRINLVRHDFTAQQETSDSSIDRDLVFRSTGDILMFSPRAMLIGLFAPFPNMWFAEGKSFGKIGRLFSSGETLLIYFLSFCAVLTIYYYRKSLDLWQLVLTVICGIMPLGFLVTNIGALYRIRYVFWFLLIIIGVRGFCIALDIIIKKYGSFKTENV